MYKSPIDICFDDWKLELAEAFDANCIKAVQSYGFKIDRAELEKALTYDRNQYEKGVKDASPVKVRIVNEKIGVDTYAYFDKQKNILYTAFLDANWATQMGYVWGEMLEKGGES